MFFFFFQCECAVIPTVARIVTNRYGHPFPLRWPLLLLHLSFGIARHNTVAGGISIHPSIQTIYSPDHRATVSDTHRQHRCFGVVAGWKLSVGKMLCHFRNRKHLLFRPVYKQCFSTFVYFGTMPCDAWLCVCLSVCLCLCVCV